MTESQKMTEDQKTWIDEASYEELLRKWRFAELGNSIFAGESGVYYSKIMHEKKANCDHVQASKNIGW